MSLGDKFGQSYGITDATGSHYVTSTGTTTMPSTGTFISGGGDHIDETMFRELFERISNEKEDNEIRAKLLEMSDEELKNLVKEVREIDAMIDPILEKYVSNPVFNSPFGYIKSLRKCNLEILQEASDMIAERAMEKVLA